MAQRRIEFDADSLLKLMTHYSEGEVPLTAQVSAVQMSQRLQRWVCLIVESEEWEGTPFEKAGFGGIQPLFMKYEGKRVMTLKNLGDEPTWTEEGGVEAPRRQ